MAEPFRTPDEAHERFLIREEQEKMRAEGAFSTPDDAAALYEREYGDELPRGGLIAPEIAAPDQGELNRRKALGALATQDIEPDKAATNMRDAETLGLPPSPVELLRSQGAAARAKRSQETIDANPYLRDWLADQQNSAVASDDLETLGETEGWFTRFKRDGEAFVTKAPANAGKLAENMTKPEWWEQRAKDVQRAAKNAADATVQEYRDTRDDLSTQFKASTEDDERNQLGWRVMNGWASEAEKARFNELLQKPPAPAPRSFILGPFMRSSVSTLRSAGSGLQAAGPTALAGAGTGATLAAGAGQVGPQVAAPEEVVTVPGAAIAGFTFGAGTGFTVGSGVASGKAEAGAAYAEFLQIKDEDGELLDPDIARMAAYAVGGANGLLETFSLRTAVRAIPGGEALLSRFSKKEMKELLRRKSFRDALKNGALRVGKVSLAEGATEAAQEATTITAGELAMQWEESQTGARFPRATLAENAERILTAGRYGFEVGLGFGGAAAGAGLAFDLRAAAQAETDALEIQALSDLAARSKVRKRAPERYEALVKTWETLGGIENVLVNAERFAEFYQSADLDPLEVADALPGVGRERFQEALVAGDDLAIPVSTYATRMAGTPADAALREHVRLHKDAMTAAEARIFRANQEDIGDRLEAIAAEQGRSLDALEAEQLIAEDVRRQLEATGIQAEGLARANADLFARTFVNLAERGKRNPIAYYSELAPQFTGPGTQASMLARARADAGETDLTQSGPLDVAGLATGLKDRHGLSDMRLADLGNGDIAVEAIDVAKGQRKGGRATKAMQELAALADEQGLRLILTTPEKNSARGTTSRSRLVKFFKRFGFVENKGRYAGVSTPGYETPQAMYRVARTKAPLRQDAPAGATSPLPRARGLTQADMERFAAARQEVNAEADAALKAREERLYLEELGKGTTTATRDNRPKQQRRLINNSSMRSKVKSLGSFDAFADWVRSEIAVGLRKGWNVQVMRRVFTYANGPDQPPTMMRRAQAVIARVDGDKIIDQAGETVTLEKEDFGVADGVSFTRSGFLSPEDEAAMERFFADREAIEADRTAKLQAIDAEEDALRGDSPAAPVPAVPEAEAGEVAPIRPSPIPSIGSVEFAALRETAAAKEARGEPLSYLERWAVEADDRVRRITLGGETVEFYQETPVPGFYSALERVIAESKTTRAPASQWKATLSRAPGVKKDELEWLGVNEWLDWQDAESQGKPIERAALLAFVQRNGVQLVEVLKRTGAKLNAQQQRQLVALIEKERDLIAQQRALEERESVEPGYRTLRALLNVAEREGFSRGTITRAHETWEAQPLAQELIANEEAREQIRREIAAQRGIRDDAEAVYTRLVQRGGDNYRELLLLIPQGSLDGPEKPSAATPAERDALASRSYTESHYDEANLLVWVRFNERTDAQGRRALFVEEIQSDWAVAGRRGGYALRNERIENARVIEAEGGYRLVGEYAGETVPLIPQIPTYASETSARDQLAEQEAIGFPQFYAKRVADMPFKAAWSVIALKRMIRWAAENDFDVLEWTSGDMQAARWEHDITIDHVAWKDGSLKLYSFDLDDGGDTFDTDYIDGTGRSLALFEEMEASAKDLPNYFRTGDIAEALANGTPGDDGYVHIDGPLPVRSSLLWMFYDRTLVNQANDIVKKYGVKVERAAITEPQPRRRGVPASSVDKSVHALPLTPELKAAALAGLPLFQEGEKGIRGLTRFKKNALGDRVAAGALIHLTEASNPSTFVHESAHFFLEVLRDLGDKPDAPADLKEMWADLMDWWGIDGDAAPDVREHEMFARTFEAYMRDGKAPSVGLRRVFEAFRHWLMRVYQALRLNHNLTPEIRSVFDRMLASDKEIAEARELAGMEDPLFESAEQAGMSPEQWERYIARRAAAREAAQAEMLAAAMETYTRQQTVWWNRELAKQRRAAAREVDEQPIRRAHDWLAFGIWRGDVERVSKRGRTPAVRSGFARWYHGGAPSGEGGKLWFTSSLADAKGWASRSDEMRVWYVDVPVSELTDRFPDTVGDLPNGIVPLSRFEFPADIADRRREFVETGADAELEPDWGPVEPPEGLARLSIDFQSAREDYGDEVVDALPRTLRQLDKGRIDELTETAKRVRKSERSRGPQRLSEFVLARGGIKDDRGDVAKMLGTRALRNKYLKADGMSLDDLALAAWESGFFGARRYAIGSQRASDGDGSHDDRPTLTEFLDALSADLRGQPVYSMDHEQEVFGREEDREWAHWFSQHDINIYADAATFRAQVLKAIDAEADRPGAVHPDIIAEAFGLESGEAMLREFGAMPSRRNAVEANAQERMRGEFGDPFADGTIADEALRIAHSTAQSRVLELELETIDRATGGAQRTLGRAAREMALRRIERMTAGDLRNHSRFLAAERRAGRAAMQALARGDQIEAALQKKTQLIAFWMYHEARDAFDELTKAETFMRSFSKPRARAQISTEELDQIDQLLEQFDMRRPAPLDRPRMSLGEWVRLMQQRGMDHLLAIDPRRVNDARKRGFWTLRVDEARGLRDTLKNLSHIGRDQKTLLVEREKQRVDDIEAEMVAAIEANGMVSSEKRDYFAPNPSDRRSDLARDTHAQFTKVEFLFRFLDGLKDNGPVWRNMFKPIADAQNRALEMNDAAAARLRQIFDAYTSKERGKMFLVKRQFNGINWPATKIELLAVALNSGNEYNKAVMQEGYGWSNEQLGVVLDNLDKRDWDTVQAIWDWLDEYRKPIFDFQERMTGVRPEKVEPSAIETRFGTYRGGYYPIRYRPDRSTKTQEREAEADVLERWGGNPGRATTRQGHLNQRQGSGGQVLRLDGLGVLNEHIADVIHDLTHREAVLDTLKLLKRPKVEAAIIRSAGRAQFNKLLPWLQAQARMPKDPLDAVDKMILHLKNGATVTSMAWKISTAMVQPLGIFGALPRLGAVNVMRMLPRVAAQRGAKAKALREFIFSRSSEMRHRSQNLDRDLKDVRDSLAGRTDDDFVPKVARDTFFAHIQFLDGLTSRLVWMTAYDMGINGKVEGVNPDIEAESIAHADSVVRMTQGSGMKKDLAHIMARRDIMQIFTAFGSYFSVLYNQATMEQLPGVATKRISRVKFGMNLMSLYLWPALITMTMTGRFNQQPGEDDDERNKRVALELAAYPLISVFFVRDIVNAMISDYGYTMSPVAGFGKALAGAGGDIIDWKFDRGFVKDTWLTLSYILGLPGRQIAITGDYIADLAGGYEDPLADPLDALREAFVSDTRSQGREKR